MGSNPDKPLAQHPKLYFRPRAPRATVCIHLYKTLIQWLVLERIGPVGVVLVVSFLCRVIVLCVPARLFVCEHGVVDRIPVHRGSVSIDKTGLV